MDEKQFDWKEISEKMKELVRIEKNINEMWVKIKMLGEDVRKDEMLGKLIQGEAQIKNTLTQFVGDGELIPCTVEFNEDENYLLIKLEDARLTKKVHAFFENLFFGNFLREMFEAILYT